MVDWKKIKKEYITTNTSLRILAAKYGIPAITVRKRSSVEHWVSLKKEHENKLMRNVIKKSAENQSEQLMRIGEAAERTLDVAISALDDSKQFNRFLVQEGRGAGSFDTVEKIYDKIDTKALKDFTAVIKELTGIFRNVYGLPTQQEAEAQRIAAERLEMDKKRTDELNNADHTINVVFDKNDWDI